jgi:RNA polymerase sigma-70 factor (ECF subfamily)
MTILISRYGDAVRRTAYGVTRSAGAAEDVAQEVFLRAWSRGGFDADRGSLQGWLQMMTRHTAIDWVRSEAARRRRTEQAGAMDATTMPAPDDDSDSAAVAAKVRVAVSQLPAPERDAVTLAYFGGLTYREVAARLGVPEGTVKSQIRRALTRLSSVLKPTLDAAG